MVVHTQRSHLCSLTWLLTSQRICSARRHGNCSGLLPVLCGRRCAEVEQCWPKRRSGSAWDTRGQRSTESLPFAMQVNISRGCRGCFECAFLTGEHWWNPFLYWDTVYCWEDMYVDLVDFLWFCACEYSCIKYIKYILIRLSILMFTYLAADDCLCVSRRILNSSI